MTKKTGFWRRNMWGLVALVPVTAAFLVIALDRTGFYQIHLNGQAKTPISAAPPDWAEFSGAKFQLSNLTATVDIFDSQHNAVKLPPEVKAWKVTIHIQAQDQSKLTDCEISLEDSQGRLFGTKPDELNAVTTPTPTCTAEDKGLAEYQVIAYFVTPADAKPVAVRVVRAEALPSYARLIP